MFRAMIEERMRERQVFVFDTTPPEQEERERHTSQIVEYVSASLGRRLQEMNKAVEQPGALEPEREFGGLGSRSDLLRHVSGLLPFISLPSIGNIYFAPSDVILSPPYGDDWQSGCGFAFGAVADGSLSTTGCLGLSVAGVNLWVTSNSSTPVSANITPMGTFEYSWVTFEDLPTLQTVGGIGVAVAAAGAPPPPPRDAILWNRSGATAFSGQSGGDELAKAASAPSPPFGAIPLFPVKILNMRPGEQHLFSLWCWQVAQYPEDAAFLAFMNAKMTAVKLVLGPPISIA